MSLIAEINQQPQVLQNILDQQLENIQQIAKKIQEYQPRYVFLAARGTSDNAGRYANYLWGAHNQYPLALATPSLFTFYQQPPQLKGALVVGISQSGMSPDIVSVVEEGRRQGNMTLAITNAPDSPLAKSADMNIDICAGEEQAVAATKTYTAQLMAVAMLSAALKGERSAWKELQQIPGWVQQVLNDQAEMAEQVQRYTFIRQCVVLGRGFNYATAFEWSLKLKELTYTIAEPYSSADFLHGPIAMVERNFPVLVVAPQGRIFESLYEVMSTLKKEHKAELVVVSNHSKALELANTPISIPSAVPEWLSPIVSIVPGQLFAYQLTKARGLNSESPRTINKVTKTE
jgi:glucosamine--fructose-6-phosphate aminotransferase (isomerizing)